MENMMFFVFSLLILNSINFIESANILALLPVASPSNQLWVQVLINALSSNGHNITVLTVDLPKQHKSIPENVHYIHLEKVYETLYRKPSETSTSTPNEDNNQVIKDLINASPIQQILLYYNFGIQICEGVLKSNGFKTLIDYPDNFKFDLILYDFTVGSILLGFAYKFKYPPLVGISPFNLSPITQDLVGGHYYPAYIPLYQLTYDVDMNFLQRCHNTFLYAFDTIYRRMIVTPKLDSMMRPVFGIKMPYIGDIEKRTILTLVNSHTSINYPQPIPPGIIEIGGMQIKESKPLEKDLELFIKNSKNGAVFFSLGTNMKPENVDPDKVNVILNVMEGFPEYNFLWKFDKNFIKREIPKNILIRSFFPQKDIFAHPKLKLFITHAGGLSTQEATWYGIPMVGLPLFLDQHRNLHKSIVSGVAVKIDYLTLSVDSLRTAIHEVLTNKSYSENMKIRSERFRDRPMKPLDTAVWWIEYVLRRHYDLQHLKSPVIDLGYFIANSFDVLGFVAVVIFIFIWMMFKFYKFLMSKTISSTKIKKNKLL